MRKDKSRAAIMSDITQVLGNSFVGSWLADPDSWNTKGFIGECQAALRSTHGEHHRFDNLLVALLADQMDVYIRASKALREEPLLESSANGYRIQNPYVKITQSSLTKINAVMFSLGLTPNGRPKRTAAPVDADEIDDILSFDPASRKTMHS